LELSATGVTDEGLAIIKQISKLRSLRVVDTKVSEQGVKDLHAALPNCTIVWNGGTLGPMGGSSTPSSNERKVAEDGLRAGWVIGVDYGNGKRERLSPRRPLPVEPFSIVEINCRNQSDVLNDESLAGLEGLRALEVLDLQGCTQVTEQGAKVIATLKTLRTLWLGGTRIGNAGVLEISRLPQVQWLQSRKRR
jgi:hypothetical protein